MKSHWIRVGPKYNACYPYKKRREHRNTERKRTPENKGRDWSDADKS